jgi:hypothetical protein
LWNTVSEVHAELLNWTVKQAALTAGRGALTLGYGSLCVLHNIATTTVAMLNMALKEICNGEDKEVHARESEHMRQT